MEGIAQGGLKYLPLLVVTGVFISYFVSTLATLELDNVRRDWTKRRCEPLVMLLASKVPVDPAIDADEFSNANFKFCMNKIIDASIAPLFTPILGIFSNQLSVAETVKQSINSLSSSASSLINPFSALMGSFNGKLTHITGQLRRSFYKLNSAFERANAVAMSAVFGGMAMWKGMDNYINFLARVIITILIVLVVLVVFLWFILFPFIPLIISTIGIVSYILGEASTAGMSGAFCVEPGTLVKTKEGYKKVEEILPGEDLGECGIVEGILETQGGPGGKYVSIEGLILSESHLVFNQRAGKWIFAKDHPDAKSTNKIPERLYCLNTSSRTWNVKGKYGDRKEITLRDWEELPEDSLNDSSWEELIFELLNRKTILSGAEWSQPGRGLFGEETLICVKGKGYVPISQIKIGDFVQDIEGQWSLSKSSFTQVAGIYKDTSEKVPRDGPNKSVWCWLESKDLWRHPLVSSFDDQGSIGYNLITESGTFVLAGGMVVRDFTEVGWDRIEKTYSFTASLLEPHNASATKENI